MSRVDPHTLNVLSLCTGVGGFDLFSRCTFPDSRTVCYVEREAFACQRLVERMEEGKLDDAPLWSDLSTFDGRPWCGTVDLILAGVPCQPVSRAGRRKKESHSHWLWYDLLRVCNEVQPATIFIENVDGLRKHGAIQVVQDLATRGYAVAWDLFSARAVGASHLRRRLFILAAKWDCLDDTLQRRYRIADPTVCSGRDTIFPPSPAVLSTHSEIRTQWPEPGLRGSSDGMADRVDRLRALGNGIVPQTACQAWYNLSRVVWGAYHQDGNSP